MKKLILLLVFLPFLSYSYSQAEWYESYFDGGDTLPHSVIFEMDTVLPNIWQVGPPQKSIFDGAFSGEGVLVTDTIQPYPINDSSSFKVLFPNANVYGVIAVRWAQKLDLEPGVDGGLLEFSIDSGLTWQNPFGNPFVYNFYGFESENMDTLPDGTVLFSGTDTVWRDIWLCFEGSWSWDQGEQTTMVRYTLLSDSNDTQQEGWMIDNFKIHKTWFHTIGEEKQAKYVEVYPNPTSNRLNIEVQKMNEFHIIRHLVIKDAQGKVVEEYSNCPTKFFVDVSDYPSGLYYVTVETNLDTKTVKCLVTH